MLPKFPVINTDSTNDQITLFSQWLRSMLFFLSENKPYLENLECFCFSVVSVYFTLNFVVIFSFLGGGGCIYFT